jgi:hypothetical protein
MVESVNLGVSALSESASRDGQCRPEIRSSVGSGPFALNTGAPQAGKTSLRRLVGGIHGPQLRGGITPLRHPARDEYDRAMADDLKRVLPGFEQAQEFARTYRFEITDEYRALLAQVESMPRNQPGADKSGPWLGSRAGRILFFAAFSPAPRM